MTLATSLNHPQRLALASEVHARPFLSLEAPARVSHLAIHVGHDRERPHKIIAAYCERFGVARRSRAPSTSCTTSGTCA